MSYTLGAADLSPAKALQTTLKKAGYYTGAIDGDLGPASAKAAGKYAEKALQYLSSVVTQVRSKIPASDVGVVDRVTKFVGDSVAITIPAAVKNRDFARLDSVMRGALSLGRVLDAYLPGTLTTDMKRFMAASLVASSDPRPVSPEVELPPSSPPGGSVDLPGGISIPKVAVAGAAVVAAWLLLKK